MPTASDNDLLLLWSVSVDWFNPYLNKISGKSVSSESIAMICLLLPPSLRIRPPFIYINGIIPHPEPAEDQVNRFLRPIMSKLDESWRHGVWYSRTYEHPRGQKVHSGIATSVNYLPGSRKVAGHASHSAKCFCALCKLTRDDINNLDMETWVAKTRDELHEQAIAWRDAPNKSTRQKLYKKHGVRWSEFWRLSYWDPTELVIIDGMHSVFLRIVQHHLRVILGMDLPADDVDDATTEPMIQASTEKALVKIHGSLTPSCTAKFLERFSKPALWEACRRYGVDLSGTSYKKAKKRTLCNALIVSSHSIPRKPVSYAVQEHAMPTTLPTVPAEGTGTRPSSEIVGNDFVTDVTSLKSTNGPSSFFTKDDLSDFQYVITTTLRPSHSTGSPAKIGTKAHGKLKADQWKAVIEFELPVYLMTKWWASDPTMLNEKERIKHELAVNTMELACAIRQNDISQRSGHACSHI